MEECACGMCMWRVTRVCMCVVSMCKCMCVVSFPSDVSSYMHACHMQLALYD